jgi:hypothetical protein
LPSVTVSAHLRKDGSAIDPPYTADGKRADKRLYAHNELDHHALFEIVATLAGDFLMTNDNSEGVEVLAREHNLDTEMTELLIGNNLNWVRAS